MAVSGCEQFRRLASDLAALIDEHMSLSHQIVARILEFFGTRAAGLRF